MPEEALPKRLVIRPWPKMILLWPTGTVAFFMALANYFYPAGQYIWGGVFLIVMAVNLFVLTFDFPRATSLTVAMSILAVILLLLLINHSFSIIDPLKSFFINRAIYASTEFYWSMFLVFGFLFIGMFIVTRFEYWELTPNEIVHHHGFLGDTERYSTAGIKLNREIVDVFEYVLAGAGRLVLLIPAAPRPVVLENVLNINRITALSDRILDARMVRIEGAAKADTEMPVPVRESDE